MTLETLKPGDVIAGRFRILREVLRRPEHWMLAVEDGPAALARTLLLLPPARVPSPVASLRFEREAAALASLRSDHIAAILDAGVEAGTPWLLLEALAGEDLAARVEREGPLAEGEAFRLLAQIEDGLAAAHAMGIVHGDLRPDAVFLSGEARGEATPAVKLLRFAVDRLTDAASPERTSWLAPEQIHGRGSTDGAVDAWAVGLIGFWMVTGRRYWKSEAVIDLANEILLAPIVPASVRARELGVAASLPGTFDAWFAARVTRDPAARVCIGVPVVPIRSFPEPLMGNPRGVSYDAGFGAAPEPPPEEPPPSTPGHYRFDRDGPYRGSGRGRDPRMDLIRANPKGSFYDGGFHSARRFWPAWVVAFLVIAATVAARVLGRR